MRAGRGVGKHFRRVFITPFTQRHIAEAGARGRAKAACLASLGDSGQRTVAGIQSVLEMLASCLHLIIREGDAAGAQFVGHVNDRRAIVIELFLDFQ